MLFSNHIPVSQQGALPHPELLLLQVQRDNLVRQNRRLVQQIEQLTHQIEEETSKFTSRQPPVTAQRALSA
jgi:hypothetical protein